MLEQLGNRISNIISIKMILNVVMLLLTDLYSGIYRIYGLKNRLTDRLSSQMFHYSTLMVYVITDINSMVFKVRNTIVTVLSRYNKHFNQDNEFSENISLLICFISRSATDLPIS